MTDKKQMIEALKVIFAGMPPGSALHATFMPNMAIRIPGQKKEPYGVLTVTKPLSMLDLAVKVTPEVQIVEGGNGKE